MCDKYNNHQTLSVQAANAILKISEVSPLSVPKMGTRKLHWVEDVIFALTKNGILPEEISSEKREKAIAQICDDTNPERFGGKLYSSIDGAVRVWKNRNEEMKKTFIEV